MGAPGAAPIPMGLSSAPNVVRSYVMGIRVKGTGLLDCPSFIITRSPKTWMALSTSVRLPTIASRAVSDVAGRPLGACA